MKKKIRQRCGNCEHWKGLGWTGECRCPLPDVVDPVYFSYRGMGRMDGKACVCWVKKKPKDISITQEFIDKYVKTH
jgi:hypothetical protein